MEVNWSNPWGLGFIFASVLVGAFLFRASRWPKSNCSAPQNEAKVKVKQQHCLIPLDISKIITFRKSPIEIFKKQTNKTTTKEHKRSPTNWCQTECDSSIHTVKDPSLLRQTGWLTHCHQRGDVWCEICDSQIQNFCFFSAFDVVPAHCHFFGQLSCG